MSGTARSGRIGRAPPRFPAEACVPEPKSGVWGDFDGDGHSDLYVVYGEDDAPSHFAATRRNRLLLWRSGRLQEREDDALAMAGRGVACASGDIDNDGDLDLVVLRGDRSSRRCRVMIALNDGDGRFSPPQDGGADAEMNGIAEALLMADLDGDGDLDLLAAIGAVSAGARDGGVRLLRNDCAGGRSLSVVPLNGERIAYGARVELRRRGGVTQVRQCWPTQVGGSSCFVPLHFGLGADRAADLTVVWPSGGRTELSRVKDRRVTVEHP